MFQFAVVTDYGTRVVTIRLVFPRARNAAYTAQRFANLQAKKLFPAHAIRGVVAL